MERRPPIAPLLLIVMLLSLAARLAALPGAHEDNVTPDGARFLCLERSLARGLGYVTPEGFPAWLLPARLPMPETIKEPGYAYAMAAVAPLAHDAFRAGQWISLLAGVLLPLLVFALGIRLEADPRVALLAGLLAAASPLLVVQSAYVMADSAFALLTTAALVAATDAGRGAGGRATAWALAAGALAGLAFLVRAQALLAVPALAWLLLAGAPAPRAWPKLAWAALAALLATSPFLVRNLRVFGSPLHSDVTAFAFWPYLPALPITHALRRPPEPFTWVLAHPAAVLRVTGASIVQFVGYPLQGEILGFGAWLAPLAIGIVLALRAARRWGPHLLYLAVSAAFLLPLYWLTRYFASVVPVIALLAALGAAWLLRVLDRLAPAPRRAASVAVILALAVLFGLQAERARRRVSNTFTPEIVAARAWGPWLRERLAPGESVVVETTSYWAWFADRPAVHLPIAAEAEVMAILRRQHARWAALPTSRLAEYAAAYPERRLPRALVAVRADRERDVTLFAIADSTAAR